MVYDADSLDNAGRDRKAERLARRIAELPTESGQPYPRLLDGDYGRSSRALKPETRGTDLTIHYRD